MLIKNAESLVFRLSAFLAEEGGFEPSRRVNDLRHSRGASSTYLSTSPNKEWRRE